MSSKLTGITRRYVLLALNEEPIEQRLLSSASALCKRMDAGLDIMLCTGDKKRHPLLENFIGQLKLEGIPCHLTEQAALSSKGVIEYANAHECIAGVMIDSLSYWEKPDDEHDKDPWRKLGCPLVVATPV